MLSIEFRNKNKKKSGKTITLELPVSGYDLQNAFAKLAITDTADCQLVQVNTDILELHKAYAPMFLITEDIPKLNILAIILNELNPHEINKFSALLFKCEPQSLDEIICIATRAESAELKYVRGVSAWWSQPTNPHKKGIEFSLIKSNSAVTPYGLAEDNSIKCRNCDHCFDGKILAEIFEEMSLRIIANELIVELIDAPTFIGGYVFIPLADSIYQNAKYGNLDHICYDLARHINRGGM